MSEVAALFERLGIPVGRTRRAECALAVRVGAVEPGSKTRESVVAWAIATAVSAMTALAAYVFAWYGLGAEYIGDSPLGSATWAMALIASAAALALTTWAMARLGLAIALNLRRRVALASLGIDVDTARAEGVGRLMGRVLEMDSLEGALVNLGSTAIFGFAELAGGFMLLALGPERISAAICAAFAGGLVIATKVAVSRRRAWITARRALTDRMIERLLGHRTELAQNSFGDRCENSSELLADYSDTSRRADRVSACLVSAVPYGWLATACLAIVAVAAKLDTVSLAITLGGVLLAFTGLVRLSRVADDLAAAGAARRQLSSLLAAAETEARASEGECGADTRIEPLGRGLRDGRLAADGIVVRSRDAGFHFPGDHGATFDLAGLEIRCGERVLVTGKTGSGKSTLASLIAGLRHPTCGEVDLAGDAKAVLVPQQNENHIFQASLAFNVLLGGDWPYERETLAEADAVLRHLGLGRLLDTMPQGILQPVGECGWRLSHGEKARVFLARALLTGADVVVLDEAFGALDPVSMEDVADVIDEFVPTLIVIAHP